VLETYRQALGDVFDLAGLKDVLAGIRDRSIRVHEVETRSASPFARSLVFAYVAAYIYEQDAPLAERRAQALTLDRGLLAELLGQAELRELIDPAVLDDLERELQHIADGRKARDADELHDLLRRLGDLSRRAGRACRWRSRALARGPRRTAPGGLAALYARVRAGSRPRMPASIAMHWVWSRRPVCPTPSSSPTDAPLEHLLRRYARTHGPFRLATPPAATGFGRPSSNPSCASWKRAASWSAARSDRWEASPNGVTPRSCADLRRRTLAKARDAVAPVDAARPSAASCPHGTGSARTSRGRIA
jgi:ATP-dependent helicase Lhr and Lhr-like helicase